MTLLCRRLLTVACIVGLVVGCAGAPPQSPPPSGGGTPRGGILRLGVPGDFPPISNLAKSAPDDFGDPQSALDPHGAGFYDSLELLRCCLARTLLSYVGRPTAEGGTELRPDLAEELPEVSEDGLTWTFHLRKGIHYAPPLGEVEITAFDFARSLHRLVPNMPPQYRPGIAGVAEYLEGRATNIAGVQTPDAHTLVVRLTHPQGDLPSRLAYPDTAPIPPHPTDPGAPFGLATGHDLDYGRFLVASGPYMIEGADQVDFTLPPEERQPASGFVPGKSLVLVSNPSWTSALDALRPAYVERIEISIGGTAEELAARVDRGELDFVFYSGAPPHTPIEQIERYRSNATLGSVHVHPRDFVRTIALNLALPPFDDIHVRRAFNLVVDKARMIEESGGPWTGEVAGHIVINSLLDNLLLTYDPYRTPGSAGDVAAARTEMALSAYDSDGDGMCDDPACQEVAGISFLVLPGLDAAVIENLEQIGINATIEPLDPGPAFGRWFDPHARTAFMVGLAFGKDHLNAASFFTSNFDSRVSLSDEETNGTLVGASPEQLELWGYPASQLPNIDDRIDQCQAQFASAQVRCWAALDQHLMENVIAWLPYAFERHTRTVGPRVVHYTFDQSIAMPALDQIAVVGP